MRGAWIDAFLLAFGLRESTFRFRPKLEGAPRRMVAGIYRRGIGTPVAAYPFPE